MKLPTWYTDIVKTVERWKRQKAADRDNKVPTEASRSIEAPTGRNVPSRLIHVGVDFGTSCSKMVFRDYEAPGGDRSYVIFPDERSRIRGDFRLPSIVSVDSGRLWFGSEAVARSLRPGSELLPSLKIRMALPDAYQGRDVPLPDGFTAADLAQLTVAYLLQHARRAITTYCAAYHCAPRMTFTVGVPMSDFDNPHLSVRFVELARVASALERNRATPDLRLGIALSDARALLDEARATIATMPAAESRQWIRPEVEAALLWAFKCPDTTPGLYAAVDVGAGTTSASFFWITETHANGRWLKSGLAFAGASCLPPGADAIDRMLANCCFEPSPDGVRGRENELIGRSGLGPIQAIVECIVATYRKAFGRAYTKDKRQHAWEDFRMFLIGGGSEIDGVRKALATRPWVNLRTEPKILDVGCPDDLMLETVKAPDYKFLLVAYGLSHDAIDIPDAASPSDVPPLIFPPRSPLDMDPDNPPEFRPTRGRR